MEDIREKFLKYGIPYDEIDKEMIELIDVFNFHLGMKTKFCCYGHESHIKPYVIFDESVTDEQVYEVASKVCTDWKNWGNSICFEKWVRGGFNKLLMNWKFTIMRRYLDPNNPKKKEHLDKVVELLRKI